MLGYEGGLPLVLVFAKIQTEQLHVGRQGINQANNQIRRRGEILDLRCPVQQVLADLGKTRLVDIGIDFDSRDQSLGELDVAVDVRVEGRRETCKLPRHRRPLLVFIAMLFVEIDANNHESYGKKRQQSWGKKAQFACA